ncbi:unnamed protein product [Brassicogethes aeneus]|uniref:Small ribosomal subunit protein mS39 n=1 Tax=Brassicogethes aeneus TaxID=1431903 RepID=A0A9P0B2V2_BRAAE|nr:unnamed protein product [Brassicogethes aeneus]
MSLFLRFRLRNIQKNTLGKTFYSSKAEEKIEIPNRIPRGPTDILRALESTVSRDPTAAHYKYHDDPFLIPMSNVGKRTFAMAQESGRKAAHWIRKEHADLFNHRECEPPIETFFPKITFNKNSKVTEEDLKNVIDDVQISEAVNVYKICKENNIEVSQVSQQKLLELLCYYNSEDTLDKEFIEERWFRQSSRLKEKQRKIWRDGNFAEELFISIENPTAEVYSAIIQGMAKHLQVERAWQLFEEAQQKGIIVNTDTYNSLIAVSNYLKEGYDQRWSFAFDLLSDLNRANLKPNLGTLNSVLKTLSTMGTGRVTKTYTLQVLREFKDIGIEPCLASWYYVLITFCKDRGPTSTILTDILNFVENKEHKIQDITDTNFFVTAMDICRNHLHDVDLARRVDKMLNFGSNYDLMGDSYKESIYYRNYFVLLSESLPLEEFMRDIYEKYVPHIYVPEPGVMGEILKIVDINGAIEFIPKLWSDMTVFDHTNRENLLETVLDIMVNNEIESELKENFSNIAWDIFNRIENQNENRTNKIMFTGDLLGKILTLVTRNKDFIKSCTVMDKLDKGHSTIVGVPKIEALSLFVDQCIEEKQPSRAISCIQYCSDSGFPEATILAARLNEKLTLDENHLNNLSKIVGDLSTMKAQ